MCGRFALSSPAENIRKHFRLAEEINIQPRFNIAPGQMVSVVREMSKGGNELVSMSWGLIPFWAKDRKIGYKLINARAETVHEKPSFKVSFNKQRCLIPADGFYEWKKMPGKSKKQPYYFHFKDSELFSFAGLWSTWTDRISGEVVESCTIITTEPNMMVKEIHDRMPVIIQDHQHKEWLDRQSSPAVLEKMLVPLDAGLMERYPVSDLCSKPINDSPECIHRV
jgi:putative SOS response-associated peptidase YedK